MCTHYELRRVVTEYVWLDVLEMLHSLHRFAVSCTSIGHVSKTIHQQVTAAIGGTGAQPHYCSQRRQGLHVICLLVWFNLLLVCTAQHGPPLVAPISSDVIARAESATVAVSTPDSLGAGFIVGTNGVLLTNYHVIQGAKSVVIKLKDGREYALNGVVAYSPKLDLALLRINDTNITHLTLASTHELRRGQPVAAIGHPLGNMWAVTQGVLEESAMDGNRSVVKVSATIDHGNSGGPIVLANGAVCGVSTYFVERTIRYASSAYVIERRIGRDFYGVSVKEFEKCPANTGIPKTSLTALARSNRLAEQTDIFGCIIVVTAGLIDSLGDGIKTLGVEVERSYSQAYRDIHGRYIPSSEKVIIYNAQTFSEASQRFVALTTLMREFLPVRTGDRDLDYGSDNWRHSIDQAGLCIDAVYDATSGDLRRSSLNAKVAQISYKRARDSLREAILALEIVQKRYDFFIADPVKWPSGGAVVTAALIKELLVSHAPGKW